MNRWFVLCLVLPACTGNSPSPLNQSPGGKLLAEKGCIACHSVDGQPGVGPTFKGLFGKVENFNDGTSLTVDETYLRQSIQRPAEKVVRSYQPVMPTIPLKEEELAAVVDFIKTLH